MALLLPRSEADDRKREGSKVSEDKMAEASAALQSSAGEIQNGG